MSTLKKYLITLFCGFLGVLGVICLKDIFHQTELKMIFSILCDGFFVAGVMLVGTGLLIFTNNEGALDGLIFSVKSFVDLFRKTDLKKYHSYYDYKAAKENRDVPFAFLIICGAFFIAVSCVMLYCYYLYQ